MTVLSNRTLFLSRGLCVHYTEEEIEWPTPEEDPPFWDRDPFPCGEQAGGASSTLGLKAHGFTL